MGHHAFKSIIVAETAKAWKDVVVQQTPDKYFTECKIGGIPKANRDHTPPASAPYPGSVLFIDIAPILAKGSLTPSTSFLSSSLA